MKLPENKTTTAGDPQTLQILESLIHSIQKTQQFKTKWSLIQTKLSDLKTLLSDLSDFPPNSISDDLIRSLSITLSDAVSLSLTCHSLNLPYGKLKTQNDVDSITAKLDNHLRELEIVIKSGVLHDGVVSSIDSKSVTKRESVRIQARNLVTRLQIGTVYDKSVALDSLLRLINEDDKNVLIAVAQGAVPVLVRLLDSSSSPEIREKTVTAIARVSAIESSKHVLIAEGLLLLHFLIKVLESGSGLAKQSACVTLQALTVTKENAKSFESRGGIASLLEICSSGTPPAQAAAAAVLRNLTVFSDCNGFIEQNAIPALLTLARSGTLLAQQHSIACLSNLVKSDDNLKVLIARKGGFNCLKTFWDTSSVNVQALEVAVEFLSTLASDERLIELICSNGFLIRLLNALNCGVLSVRTHSAEAVYKIGYCNKLRKELGELGFIEPLVNMLDGKSFEEVESGSKALSRLLICNENRRVFRRDIRGVTFAVRVLDPLVNVEKKYAVSVLLSLAHSKKCRKQMVKDGALVYLEKLVVMEVEGAKGLQDAIGGGKMFGVFRL